MSQTFTTPNGRLAVVVQFSDGRFEYSVLLEGETVISKSLLGHIRSDCNLVDEVYEVHCLAQPDLADSYTLLQGKQRRIAYTYKRWECELRNVAGQLVKIEFALSDAAIAFRYHHAQDNFNESRELLSDATTVRVVKAEDDLQLAQPYDVRKSQYQTFYQPRDVRQQASIGSREYTSNSPDGYGLPALFRTTVNRKKAWLMIKEAGFDGSAPASHIADVSEDGVVSFAFPSDVNGHSALGTGRPQLQLPWTSPWRIITIGTTPQTLIQDTSVTDLSVPSQIEDTTWIHPGSTSWSWYANLTNPISYTAAQTYIDLAADLAWPYSLLDATWDQQINEQGRQVSLEESSEYARSRNVRLWVWMNSAGPNNDAYDVTPRDLLFDPIIRRQTMEWLVDLGIAGIKVDGIESEKTDMMRYLLEILADAAEFKLMIVFHNSPVPHGWERTWPNLLSSEGLVTSEYYTNKRVAYAPQMPENNVNQAFVRLTIGPADYAPGTISQDIYPFDAPITTISHEIALYIIIDSGLRCFPEAPKTYLQELDHRITGFLSDIPFVWDETQYLAGEPGKFFVVAKKSGNRTYIAGINGETSYIAQSRTDRSTEGVRRRMSLPVADLGQYMESAFSVSDLIDNRQPQVNSGVSFNGTHLDLTMEPFGGFVVVFSTMEGNALSMPALTEMSDWSWVQIFLIVLPVFSLVLICSRRKLWRASTGKHSP